jgi:hypothetical protein
VHKPIETFDDIPEYMLGVLSTFRLLSKLGFPHGIDLQINGDSIIDLSVVLTVGDKQFFIVVGRGLSVPPQVAAQACTDSLLIWDSAANSERSEAVYHRLVMPEAVKSIRKALVDNGLMPPAVSKIILS